MKSEREKMLAGELYLAADADLVAARLRCRLLLADFNASAPDDLGRRRDALSQLLGALGAEAWIEPPFWCDYGFNLGVGARFYANFNLTVLDCAPVQIGDDVMIGPSVGLYTAEHPLDPDERLRGLERARPILIGDHVWLGGGVIVLPGVCIGAGTTVGAGSVVTRDLPANVLAAGNPCRVLRSLR